MVDVLRPDSVPQDSVPSLPLEIYTSRKKMLVLATIFGLLTSAFLYCFITGKTGHGIHIPRLEDKYFALIPAAVFGLATLGLIYNGVKKPLMFKFTDQGIENGKGKLMAAWSEIKTAQTLVIGSQTRAQTETAIFLNDPDKFMDRNHGIIFKMNSSLLGTPFALNGANSSIPTEKLTEWVNHFVEKYKLS